MRRKRSMSVRSRQDEGTFGSLLALFVVGGFIALAARLTDGGPVETVTTTTPDAPSLAARPDQSPIPHPPLPDAERILTQG